MGGIAMKVFIVVHKGYWKGAESLRESQESNGESNGGIAMEFNIPKKLKVGSVDYEVKIVEHCGDDDFGLFKCCQSIIKISNKVGGY